jgi:hypothetical protein
MARFAGIAVFLILVAASIAVVFLRPRPEPSADLPRVFFWAWERSEDLRFLEGRPDAGVAFLAGTIKLTGGKAEVRPRLQPLRVARGTVVAPVIRIESDQAVSPTLSSDQVRQTVQTVLDLTRSPGFAMIQIDYDAVVSERHFYRQFLERLRLRLPEGRLVSITALASWCLGDPWIRDLPVDEVVPMLFQMGPDAAGVRRLLHARADFRLDTCRQAVGLSTDESWPAVSRRRRCYVFSPTAWSQRQAERVLEEVNSQP